MNEKKSIRGADDLPRFDRDRFGETAPISAVSTGAVGGKAAGLIAAQQVLEEAFPDGKFRNLHVSVPATVVLGADAYTSFLERNDLADAVTGELADERIAHAFQQAVFPDELVGDIHALVGATTTPLAIRSSSLLEDATGEPFAGVYATKMIPNRESDRTARFKRIIQAIKFVYASTFFREARGYREMTGRASDEERMAVIVQEVVGLTQQDRFYPTISGVARSTNYYPTGAAQPADGVVNLALGLGKTIVDGGRCWTYCPAYPNAAPPVTTADLLKNTQTEFWAVNMGPPPAYDPTREDEFLVRAGLKEAEYDGALARVASTYDPGSDRVVMGTGREGPRVLDFATLLQLDDYPLNPLVRMLLARFEDHFGSDVEIEFALSLDPLGREPPRFGFLQVRGSPPIASGEELEPEDLTGERVIASSEQALGHGRFETRDVVYVRPEAFDKARTPEIARQIGEINRGFLAGDDRYLLFSFGRVGSTDPWLGVPVDWGQISRAGALVEATLPELDVDLSQGSHFFHNVTSLGLLFLTVRHTDSRPIDWAWLDAQETVTETELVRHVRVVEPLVVRVDGRHLRGVISK